MNRVKKITQVLTELGFEPKGGKLKEETTIYIESQAFGWHYLHELKSVLTNEVGSCVVMITAARNHVQIHVVL